MKFNCDRCKTRYSIADERVRGKVLKIRCKNCSSVITVREGASVVAPRSPRRPSTAGAPLRAASARAAPAPVAHDADLGGPTVRDHPRTESALHSAFHDVMGSRQPSAADSLIGGAPGGAVEWFVAVDGHQDGPFDLAAARRWVQDHAEAPELYCWSEGFDDWLPVEKVEAFAAALPPERLAVGSAPALPEPEPELEPEPQPLFAATMAQVAADAPTLMEGDDPFSTAYGRRSAAAGAAADSFELDIGEASQVVDLASLQRRSPAPTRDDWDDLPGLKPDPLPVISGLTNPGLDLPRPDVLQPRRERRSPIMVPLIAAIAVLAVVLGVLLYLALSGGGQESEDEISRAGVGDRRDLTSQYTAPRPGAEGDDGTGAKAQPAGAAASRRNGRSRPARRTRPGDERTPAKEYRAPAGEVDLSGAKGLEDPVKQGSLDPGDVEAVYRKKQFSVNRCYENAMKRNPLLEVPKTFVSLAINGGGRVTKVSIPALEGEPLGRCLVASIGRWRFPKSTEGFAGRFPIVFRSH